jgi:Sel1 repeat
MAKSHLRYFAYIIACILDTSYVIAADIDTISSQVLQETEGCSYKRSPQDMNGQADEFIALVSETDRIFVVICDLSGSYAAVLDQGGVYSRLLFPIFDGTEIIMMDHAPNTIWMGGSFFQAYQHRGEQTTETEYNYGYDEGNFVLLSQATISEDGEVTFDYIARPEAEQGFAAAQTTLGLIYGDGRGAPKDFIEAVKWLRLAALQGEVRAQNRLAFHYLNGLGVPQSNTTAYMWWEIARAVSDDMPVSNYYDHLGLISAEMIGPSLQSRMTSGELAEAQQRSRVCIASSYRDCH